MATSDKNMLESNEENLFKQLLLQQSDGESGTAPTIPTHALVPQAGFCLKTKDGDGEKVFINVCTGENLPAPKEMSDEDLLKLLEADDPAGFRIPMSLGEPHAELDKGSKGCTAYDVVISPLFYERVQRSQVVMGFFLTVVLEGLEYKYKITLNREWSLLKNRKFVGSLPEQNIRKESKPWIMEMDGDSPNARPLISEVDSPASPDPPKPSAPPPPYTIIQEPAEGYPEYLVTEMHIPKVKSVATVTLDVGEDRIVLLTRSNIYHLDIYLPYNVIQESCAAQFNMKTKILTLTMPVAPPS